MKNTLKKMIRGSVGTISIVTVFGFFLLVSAAFAATEQFAPTLAIPISTIKFTPAAGGVPYLGQYIGGLYEYVSALASFLAGIMFVIGGLQYIAGQPDEGKKRIQNATAGLILTLSAYTILNTVNFNLTHFKPIPIASVENKKFTSLNFKTKIEKQEGDECDETSECKEGLKCEKVKSAKELAGSVAAQAITLATNALEKMKQSAFDAADSADTVAESLYNAAMQAIAEGEKYLAKSIPAAAAKIAADKLRTPVTAARKAATDIRDKARAAAEEAFKKATESLAAQLSSVEKSTAETKENQKKECTK